MLYQEINCLNDENYENLVDKIEEEDNVNYTNADGMTLLHFAAKYNQLNVIEAMVGAKRLPNNFGYAPIHCAVEEGSLKVLRYFLKVCSKKEILATEAEQRNLLHIAVESSQIEALRILLDDGRFNDRLEDKDMYGRTPYDVAVQVGNDKAIRLLSPSAPKDLTTLQGYDTAVDLSQNNLECVLSDYLNKKNVDVKEILYTLGNCNGWEFLYQIYLTMGKEEEYFLMLKAIALWDRKLSSLKNRPPPGLEHYTDIKDIFEQLISNLVIAHSGTKASRELNTGLQQTSRKKQYDLLKDP